MKSLPVLLALLALSGCAVNTPPTLSLSDAIGGVQRDLTQTGVVAVSHASSWSLSEQASFDQNVRQAQCAQNSANPLVAMIGGPVTLNLQGGFTQSGSFSVAASSLTPTFGINADASRSKTQGLSISVQFVPLASLPDALMGREVDYAGALLAQNDDTRHDAAKRITADRDALVYRVQTLEDGYTGETCASGPVRPFVGVRHA